MYDYFIKDHLGNVRMVLTEEQRVGTYTAVSFEDASVSEEQIYFENVDVQRTVKPIKGTQEKAQLLRKNTRSVGVGKLLKVMAGDRLHVKVDYYTPSGVVDNREANGLTSVLNNLVSVLEGGAARMVSKGQGSGLVQSLEQAGELGEFFRSQGAQVPGSRPKAYLNILFFDEQLRFVGKGSEAVQVKDVDSWQQLSRLGDAAKKVPQNGYAYVYVSNESNNLVYFDNLQVSQQLGPILEETHYYPFGLTMAGISSKAAGNMENKRKFNNGTELSNQDFSDGSGIELYETLFRNYDPQIGKFNRIDPLADIFNDLSPFIYAYNNPILFNDPYGLSPIEAPIEKAWVKDIYTGEVYWDKDVIKPNDVKPGQVYIGDEIIIKDENGNVVGYGNNQGTVSWVQTQPEVKLKPIKIKYDSYFNNPFKQTGAYRHWFGTRIDTYSARLDDGDALRFFSDIKEQKQGQGLGEVVAFLPLQYWLSVAISGLTLLSDKQIDAIVDQYNKTGDKKGIKIQVQNMIEASTGNTYNYSIYSIKNNERLGQISQVVMGPAF